MIGRVQFLPLAIKRANDASGGVGALTRDGAWIPVEITDVEHDWIVPEVRFNEVNRPHIQPAAGGADPTFAMAFAAELAAFFARAAMYLTVGLTKPNRFLGRFRGCQPLVVGVHVVPDYTGRFATEATS